MMATLIRYSVALLVCVISSAAFAYTNQECMKCHTGKGAQSRLVVSPGPLMDSVHGEGMGCADCHQGVLDMDHTTTRGAGAVNCGECHETRNDHGLTGQGRRRPACHTCHTRHAILGKENRASSIHPDRLKKTCGTCHPSEFGTGDYLSWLPSIRIATHGKQNFGLAYDGDNCIGCHQGKGVHGERGPVNDDTCYKCHGPFGGRTGLMGPSHARADRETQPGTFTAAVLYQGALVLLLYGGFRFYTHRPDEKAKKQGDNPC